MTVTWTQERVKYWDGPDDTWLPADDALRNYLESFTVADVDRLKQESRIVHEQHIVAPSTIAQTVIDAIESPSVRTAKALRSLSNRELVDALNVAKSRQERQTRRRVTDGILARPGRTVTW